MHLYIRLYPYYFERSSTKFGWTRSQARDGLQCFLTYVKEVLRLISGLLFHMYLNNFYIFILKMSPSQAEHFAVLLHIKSETTSRASFACSKSHSKALQHSRGKHILLTIGEI